MSHDRNEKTQPGLGMPLRQPDRKAFSVAIFARQKGKVLVIHHNRLATWLPVGGELEEGESPIDAAERELKEETGLKGRFFDLEGAYDGVPPGFLGYEEHLAGTKGLHMNFVFLAEIDDSAQVVPNEEYSDFRWVDAAELGELSCPKNVVEFGLAALSAKRAS